MNNDLNFVPHVKQCVIIILMFLIQSCATPYQERGFRGGFSETQLDVNVFRVRFGGNALTSPERASDYTLLRSAELTLEHGYKYFVIVDSKSRTKERTITTSKTYKTTADVYSSGNSASITARTTTSGGDTYTISKPSLSNLILCFKERPEDTFSYDADFVYRSLAEKYKVKQK